MKLPGGDQAVIDISKLRDYCLNLLHPRGRHKARVFLSALGLTQSDAEILKTELLRAAREGEALEGETDQYGVRYIVDFMMSYGDYRAPVRSAWIVLHGETTPRLTSCFVLLM